MFEKGEVRALASFELSFKELVQLQRQRDDGEGAGMSLRYLYSTGYAPAGAGRI